MNVALIGLNHGYQFRGCQEARWDAFEAYLLSYARTEGVDLIAEELSEEALRKWKATGSVARHVAGCLGIRHQFCDPDSSQREAIGIQSFGAIAAALGPNPDLAAVEAKERESWPIRRRFWLERLREIPFTRSVFILGSKHVEAFEDLIRSQGWGACVVHRNWEP